MAEQKAKVVHGPGPRGMGGPRPKVENPGKLLKRIMAEVFQHYLPHCILVLICIVVSALANVQASLFLQTLIDDYIIPMTQQQDPSFAPLAGALVRVGCIYVVGILAAWLNARIMVNVTQGTLRNLRIQLFTHMESLPISYFDTHPHGDIMSVYTNDVDTLRQMLSQSIPQLVSSAITIVSVFASMCMLSWQLTIVTMLMVALMLFCSKKITQQSGKYFIAQQRDLGKVNGYIEEMMEGQKVVKVFTHEQKALEGFRELNDKLKDSAKQANSFANIMMPVNAQLGNISYAICALVGAAMAVTGMGGVTLGTVMAFLSLNKSFNMPISQVSMQANSIIMALAGAERIFKMMDEPSETDEGYVTLINAKYDKDDNLVEANERTGIWAWKHPTTTAPPPTTSWKATSPLRTSISAICRTRPSCTTSTSMAVRARRSPSSAPPAPARPPSPTLSTASTTSRTARSGTTASTSTRSRKPTSAALWASCCRIPTCSPARSWRTSAMAVWRPPTRSASPQPVWPTPTASSSACPRATTPC